MGSGGKLYERQAPYNDPHNWKYDIFSGLSVAGNNSNSLLFTDLNMSTPIGAAFAMNRYGGKTNLLLYTVSTDGRMEQHQYYTANDTLSETKYTSLSGAASVPMTTVSQNKTSLFSVAERPECSWPFPLTQLALS
ncbi:uncharacterized protein LTHEOB_2989 [Lasiodiplodia theobromae]|uniref:uncharacterized protein n=1 Tax=Lasiodiplodia theobromae TaxID=45133 RepID=UPI0015C2E264|nr:uncharacterized protein LTHEOB_2989 [Lasiodiplodia theobromae]KAF4535014.1 hypothetical protein LTHEOB_2989 [Lasiodiplodia theobromae]